MPSFLLSIALLACNTDPDADGDGFEASVDCNDGDVAVHPGQTESCDGIDNDCDGDIDEGVTTTHFLDRDLDGYGDPEEPVQACAVTAGLSLSDLDCDDTAIDVSPAAEERCNDVDDDCDGDVDEEVALADTWFVDQDGDGHGDPSSGMSYCGDPGTGYAADDLDCDDTDADVRPGGIEVCNGADDDCNGLADDGALDALAYYPDSDGDGLGDADATAVFACTAPSGTVGNAQDCDDTVDGAAAPEWFTDADGDGHGDPASTVTACVQPPDTATVGTDCDDTDADANPDAPEVCDGRDNDCDGDLDEDGQLTDWYLDADGDGYGDPTATVTACAPPQDAVANADDCDDADPDLNPLTVWYADLDGDGVGHDSSVITQCTSPGANWSLSSGDCEPADPTIYPGAPEVCTDGTEPDGIDDDCDGIPDDGCSNLHCGTITDDEVWGAGDHRITCDLFVEAVLTLEAGANIQVDPGVGVYVGWNAPGELEVQGTVDQPVTVGPNDPDPVRGSFDGINFGTGASGSILSGMELRYAGETGLNAYPGAVYVDGADITIQDSLIAYSGEMGIFVNDAAITVERTVIRDNTGPGVLCATEQCLDPLPGSFTDNQLTDNWSFPIRLWPSAVGSLSPTNTILGNTDDTIVVTQGFVRDSAYWHPQDVPYRFESTVQIEGPNSPTLTIADGAELVFPSFGALYVGLSEPASLVVDGSTRGVRFGSASETPAPGDWTGIVLGVYSEDNAIAGAEIAHAGGLSTYPAGIMINASGTTSSLVDVTVHDSARNGVSVGTGSSVAATGLTLRDNAGTGLHLADNAELGAPLVDSVLTGNEQPIRLSSLWAHRLDPSSSFVGNTNDRAEIRYTDWLTTSRTWQALDVPYYASNGIYVGSTDPTSPPVLTIEDGAALTFGDMVGLWVATQGRYGDLVLDGDRSGAQGIVLRSETNGGAGSWYGLTLGLGTSAATELRGFTLRDAGYSSSFLGGIHVEYGRAVIRDALLEDNERYGVYVLGGPANPASLEVTDTTIRSTTSTDGTTLPDGDGIHLTNQGSTSLTLDNVRLTANARYPLAIHADQMVDVESEVDGSQYTGNGVDNIFVHGGQTSRDGAWADPGVPWLIGGDIDIRSAITMDGGTMEMGLGRALLAGTADDGSLDATDVLFTSSRGVPLQGDWCGVHFGEHSFGSALTGSTIEFAGQTTGCPPYIAFPSGVSTFRTDVQLSGSTIRYSAGDGVNVYYSPTASITGNTLRDNAGFGVSCSFSTGATVSGNTYANNTLGNTTGCN